MTTGPWRAGRSSETTAAGPWADVHRSVMSGRFVPEWAKNMKPSDPRWPVFCDPIYGCTKEEDLGKGKWLTPDSVPVLREARQLEKTTRTVVSWLPWILGGAAVVLLAPTILNVWKAQRQ